MKTSALLIIIFFFVTIQLNAQEKAKYVPYKADPVIKEMIDQNKKIAKQEEQKTEEIRNRQKEEKKVIKESRKRLRPEASEIKKPGSPESFKTAWHIKPVAQYLTGTCWDFATTSFFESEIYRLSKEKIKLSEIHTAYYEYIEKVRRFVRERGNSAFGQGSEANAVTRIWKMYGCVPEEIYTGLYCGKTRHDHSKLFKALNDYLNFIKDNDNWDEITVLNSVKVILNRYLGEPPRKFTYKGKEYSPLEFYKSLPIDVDDYVNVMSTSSEPFFKQGLYDVPDNWWKSEAYYNLPLDAFYDVIKTTINKGQTVSIGGDVSEPGYYGEEDICFIPSFDIPTKDINQDAREFRFYNKTSTDDHLVHLVGYKNVDGRDWFLIKDSARSSRSGQYEGYLFYRGDYIRLKILMFMVHKSAIEKYLDKFEE